MIICRCGRTASPKSDKCRVCTRKGSKTSVARPTPTFMTTLVEWFCGSARVPEKKVQGRGDATQRTRLLRRYGDPTAASDVCPKLTAAEFLSRFPRRQISEHALTALGVIRQSHGHEVRTRQDWAQLFEGLVELARDAAMWPSPTSRG